jgi:hypothetical protein
LRAGTCADQDYEQDLLAAVHHRQQPEHGRHVKVGDALYASCQRQVAPAQAF